MQRRLACSLARLPSASVSAVVVASVCCCVLLLVDSVVASPSAVEFVSLLVLVVVVSVLVSVSVVMSSWCFVLYLCLWCIVDP